ncbi:ATP-dependent nuclease [Pinirhizobacter soli]|uniref:ATP-dependent nuclease n=1 Tax=Pinirhizobacter soli TaxID=2786953 RepID=UPI002029D5BD|nr:ATP-binding protein [Pinirhizobacter soli]
MKYRETDDDKKLRRKFKASMDHAYLHRLGVAQGTFRGLSTFALPMAYPITAIAGKNGSGKSSVLALACCAYHNGDDGFKLPRRALPYYTFKDFFIRHRDDPPQRQVRIDYLIAYNQWKPSPRIPSGIGVGLQSRHKKAKGRWNDYADRVEKNVIYLGIERVVPHFERSQSRSYSSVFRDVPAKGWEENVAKAVGHILGKNYTKFRYVHHAKYSLPVVECDGVVYSGFHMGAGESALFEIFSTIYECGESSLIVIDEIELGLHTHAQRKFMDCLKALCRSMHIQIICTTHSRDILAELPPDARFFLERIAGKTRLTPNISPDFAFSKMAHVNSHEVTIFVEDDVAAALLNAALPAVIRTRVAVIAVGSASAIARQLAAAYMRKESKYCLAVFDGDQRKQAASNLAHSRNMAESPGKDFDDWINRRFLYLPGDTWTESWIMEKSRASLEVLAIALAATEGEIANIIEYAVQAGKHSEFVEMERHLGLPRTACLQHFSHTVATELPTEFDTLRLEISTVLDG